MILNKMKTYVEKIVKRIRHMNLMIVCVLVMFSKDDDRKCFCSFNLLAPRFLDRDFESFFDPVESPEVVVNHDEDEDDIREIDKCNWLIEIVKVFNQKCVRSSQKDSVYAFRQCAYQCFCKSYYDGSQRDLKRCVNSRT